jgi:hypothetical protein
MDKKMHQVTKKMEKAVKVIKGAEAKNEKLVKQDKNVRDPQIKQYKAMKRKGCHA